MANEAHKEPTMEEILASIRKIISDDTVAPPAKPAVAAVAPAVQEPVFANDEDENEDEWENAEVEAPGGELDEAMFADADEDGEGESFEELLGAARAAVAAPVPQPAPAPPVREFMPEPARAREPAPALKPRPAPVEEPVPSPSRYEDAILTDDNTATAAAGAMAKLIGKMDLGGDHTLEGLVREMLRPMMKEWLDANLAKIVEQKVEAEVARIARMAR